VSKVGDFLKNTDTQNEKDKALSLRDKKVQDYSKDEAIAAMVYLSNSYTKYKEV